MPKSLLARAALATAVVLTAMAAGVIAYYETKGTGGPANEAAAGPRLEADIELIGHDGEPVRGADLHGSYTLLFFGYTNCPDICGPMLNDISAALATLAEQSPEKAEAVRPVFVTVDPARDTVPVLRDYVTQFHPRLLGLTGKPAALDRLVASFKVYVEKGAPGEMAGTGGDQSGRDGHDGYAAEVPQGDGYLVAHSSTVFLLGPDGRYVAHFDHTTSVENIAKGLSEFVEA